MHTWSLIRRPRLTAAFVIGPLTCLLAVGCGSTAGRAFEFLGGTPYPIVSGTSGTTGPASTGRQTGTAFSGSTAGEAVDPCSEPAARKLIRISMRNQSPDYIHYFLVLIAYVNGTEYPDGAVCASDVTLYTRNGYTSVPAGQTREFGNYCIRGPALYYFHQGGRFRSAAGVGGGSLGSAIGPAQGTTPTYDAFFTSAGATLPVPELILFHNPGATAEQQALRISRSTSNPCATTGTVVAGDPVCAQDSFYYVDENDIAAGSTALGTGSGRRVPGDIQGTGCECLGTTEAWARLAPSGRAGQDALCNEFFRGGRIDFAFVRDDTEPPYPQLLWRVTDASGFRAHDFDTRANLR